MRVFHSQEIKDEAQVGGARRAVQRFAAPLGFSDDELAEIAIVVQEIGTNAAKYSRVGGRLHWTTPLDGPPGLELFYWDKGPGIFDIDAAVRDGVTTGGGLGTGFGAIRRLTDEFDVYSTLRATTSRLLHARRTTHGTVLLCRKRVGGAAAAAAAPADEGGGRRRIGAWSRCRAGEDVNGDGYFVGRHGGRLLLAVVDGLGHGRGARDATAAALGAFEDWAGEPPDEVLTAAHDALRATRGAVAAAVVIDREGERFHYAGVGNVDVRVFNSPEPVRPVPTNGTLGSRLSSLRVWPYRWSEGTTVVMTSDGISATWDIGSYPGLLARSPQLFAGVLLRDYGRDSDDATALVVR